jgi:hypothetical protein
VCIEAQYSDGALARLRQASGRAKSSKAGFTCVMSIAVVAATLCAPKSVGAATIHATIVGTIKTGTDYNGVFVGQNSPLARFPFTAIFTFDPNGGAANGNQTTCSNGRIASGLNTPVTEAKLIINDKTYEFNTIEAANFAGSLVSSKAGATSPKMQLSFHFHKEFDRQATGGTDDIMVQLYLNGPGAEKCRDWQDPFDYVLQAGDSGAGANGFGIDNYSINQNNGHPLNGPPLAHAQGYFSVTRVTLTQSP